MKQLDNGRPIPTWDHSILNPVITVSHLGRHRLKPSFRTKCLLKKYLILYLKILVIFLLLHDRRKIIGFIAFFSKVYYLFYQQKKKYN